MQRELVERARSGDHDAFSVLARASIGRLYGVATLILRDSDRAQDAVQEALVSAWRDVRAIQSGRCGTCLHLRDLSSGDELPLRFDPTEGGLKLKFSADGTHVVFEGTTDGRASQHLVYAPLDGSGPSVQIGPSYGNANRQGFDFSPDGTKVILTLSSGSTIIDLATGATTPVPHVRTTPYWQRLAR